MGRPSVERSPRALHARRRSDPSPTALRREAVASKRTSPALFDSTVAEAPEDTERGAQAATKTSANATRNDPPPIVARACQS